MSIILNIKEELWGNQSQSMKGIEYPTRVRIRTSSSGLWKPTKLGWIGGGGGGGGGRGIQQIKMFVT